VGPGHVDRRVGMLGVAEHAHEFGDPVQARLDPGLGPAGFQLLLHPRELGGVLLPLRAPHLGDRPGRQVVVAVVLLVAGERAAEGARGAEPLLSQHLGDVLVARGVPALVRVVRREPLSIAHADPPPAGIPSRRALIRATSSSARSRRARIFSTTCSGALPRNASLPSLAPVVSSSLRAAARSFSRRRRSAARSMVPEVSISTPTVARPSRTSSEAVAVKSSAGGVRRASEVTCASTSPGRSASAVPVSRAGTR